MPQSLEQKEREFRKYWQKMKIRVNFAKSPLHNLPVRSENSRPERRSSRLVTLPNPIDGRGGRTSEEWEGWVCSNVFSKALCSKCVMNQMCYEPNEFKTQVEHNTSGTQHFWNTFFTKHIETHTLHTLYFRRAHMHARTHARYEFARESVGISDQTTYPPPAPHLRKWVHMKSGTLGKWKSAEILLSVRSPSE